MSETNLQSNTKLAAIKRPGVKFDVLDNCGMVVASLLPVCDSNALDDELLEKMSAWRNRARCFFKTQFTATKERTRKWIESNVIPSSDRVLFLVCVEGRVIGHFGLCNIDRSSAELDNAIRGEKGGGVDLFKYVERTLFRIAFDILEVEKVTAKVFSNNFPALQLHCRQGMIEWARVPLRRIESPSVMEYMECAESESNVNFKYVIMQIERNSFLASK